MKKVLKVIVDILAWVLLILAALITLMVFASERNNGVASLLGFMPMSVQSDSMSPTFNKGDLIVVKKVDDLYSLKEGDVITFFTFVDSNRIINTHRIVEVKNEDNNLSFVTRGDNNAIDDELPVYASDIIGKWTNTKLSKLGSFLDFLKTKKGFFICVLIPIAIFFIFELYKFVATIIETKNEMSEEDEEEIKRKAVEEYLAAQKAKEAEEKEADTTDSVADKAEEAVEKAADAAESVAEKAEEAVEKAAETVEETVEEAKKVADASTDDEANA